MTEKAIKEILRLLRQELPPVQSFEIRSYGKAELAMLYFPHAKTKKGALKNLNYRINYNGELRERLRALGNPPKAQHYTRQEVKLIIEYLCEP